MMTAQDQLEAQIAQEYEQFMEELRGKFAYERNDRWRAFLEDQDDLVSDWNPEEESWEEFLKSDSISDRWEMSEEEAWNEAQDAWKDVEASLRGD